MVLVDQQVSQEFQVLKAYLAKLDLMESKEKEDNVDHKDQWDLG